MGAVNIHYSDGTEEIEGLDPKVREVAGQLQQWVNQSRAAAVPSMIERTPWTGDDNPISNIKRARHEIGTNDLVGTFGELIEGITFQGVKWESGESDIADFWNQMAAEQNLDNVVRQCGRETFFGSQVVVGTWWDWGEFKVRGRTKKGNARRTTKRIYYPRAITILDGARVIPVGLMAFGGERLCWEATDEEFRAFLEMKNGNLEDQLMSRLFVDVYIPTELERRQLVKWKVKVDRLILLNPEYVRRHTLTKSDYEPFAPVRMRSVFHWLDMRQQLMEADRVHLIGAANYILLVKKGDKDNPGQQSEIDNLKANFRTLARVPVIFSDHRLTIEIVTPKQDYTLDHKKYDMVDRRIIQRLLTTVTNEDSSTGGSSGAVSMGKPMVRVLEGRRRMLRRFLEVMLARDVVNHPANEGLADRPPSLSFSPANILIGDDGALAQQILSLRTQKEISRESTLEYFGFDQEAEAVRRQIEEAFYDDIFQTQVPFSANGNPAEGKGEDDESEDGAPPADQAGNGAKGGRPRGGGRPSQSPTKTRVTDSGNTSSKGS